VSGWREIDTWRGCCAIGTILSDFTYYELSGWEETLFWIKRFMLADFYSL